MKDRKSNAQRKAEEKFAQWRADWNVFAKEVLGVELDAEQQAIVSAVQHNKRVSVRSGTARGKDYVSAVIALCFLYLTPRWRGDQLVENTKVALTAPTDRQVKNIMMPEISRLYNRAKRRGIQLAGKLNSYDIRTDEKEWFLTGFKADEHNHEAWSGFHAANTMFIVTEATGISDDTFAAIEGNLQGNSRILLVFNPNTTIGYAAKSQQSNRWARFRLSDLSAPNVIAKKTIYPGQVDYEWVKDKVENWCEPIREEDVRESENDFEFEGQWYRPSDLARKKVLGEFPKAEDDVLIPQKWIELAQERWRKYKPTHENDTIMGVDAAGMGRDCSVFCRRQDNYVWGLHKENSGGKANHMAVAGQLIHFLKTHSNVSVSIDTIGEGAGVYSRVVEEFTTDYEPDYVVSCKFSEAARYMGGDELTDVTGQYKFANMRAYLHWAVRDWLDPDKGSQAMLPPDGTLMEEATSVRWSFLSNGKIIIEPKDDIKERLGHSPDEFDALCNTFHPMAIEFRNDRKSRFEDDYDLDDVLY